MALTKAQRRLLAEAREIAAVAGVDTSNIEQREKEWRTVILQMAINRMVLAHVISWYTLLDERLSDLICKYYFKKPGSPRFVFWRQKRFRIFANNILDEMFLIKKMEVVNAIKPLPKEVRSTIHKVNFVRNGLAHSFFPENRKEYRKMRKVLYNGADIRTGDGLKEFEANCHEAFTFLSKRTYPKWRGES